KTGLEILGFYLRRSRFVGKHREILEPSWICGRPGIWNDGNSFSHQPQPPVPLCYGLDWPGVSRNGGAGQREWRNSGPRRERRKGLPAARRKPFRGRKRWMVSHRRHGGERPERPFVFQGPEKERHCHARRNECLPGGLGERRAASRRRSGLRGLRHG